MNHIIANPHNGTTVEHDGITLEPGHEVLVCERDAHEMAARYGFLLHRVADKTALKEGVPKALAQLLNWDHVNHGTDEVPRPDAVQHTASNQKAPKVAKPRAATPRKRKVAKK